MGSTPTVRLRSVRPPGGAELWLKLEHLNPSGSIEDRAGAAIVDAAPEVEATALASRLAREEGLLVGPETGAGVVAALRVAGGLQPSEAVLAFALDGGERYFSADMERGT